MLPYYRYTLIFITRGDEVLMLRRRKAPNQGLWNGVGGHLEEGETPAQGALREVREETGYDLPDLRFAGLLTWEGHSEPPGGLYIFTAEAPPGPRPLPTGPDEGRLAWRPREWVCSSPQVVSNIPIFAPSALSGGPPAEYHFVYGDHDDILSWEARPLPGAPALPTLTA